MLGHEITIACKHVLEQNCKAEQSNYSELLCKACIDKLDNDIVPFEVKAVCKDCIIPITLERSK